MLFTLPESGFTRKQKEQIPDQLRRASRAGAICAACAALGALALAVFARPDPLWPEVLFSCAPGPRPSAHTYSKSCKICENVLPARNSGDFVHNNV